MLLNGPSISLQDVADSLEWAQQYFWEVSSMLLNGPSISLQDAADSPEWAQQYSREVLPTL
jgi:hypothetical protein